MNIGFDAKRVFHNRTGLGNYSRDVVRLLSSRYPKHSYFLYNPKKAKIELDIVGSGNVFEKKPSAATLRFFSSLWRQKYIVKDLTIDNIQLFHGLSGEIPIGLNQEKIRSVVTIHDLIFMRFPHYFSYLDRKIYFRKFKYAAKHADRIIAISEQTKNDIVHFLDVPEEKITVVYQGCQEVFKRPYSDHQKKALIAKYKLPSRFILNVGTVEERKNLWSLIKAVENIETKLIVVGSTKTDYAKQIKRYIAERNLASKVIFLKGISNEELAILYQLADMFIYPSLFEGFGIPIVEALYSKTPVITTLGGCFPEAGGPYSLYLKNPQDPLEIAEKIESILTNAQLGEQIAQDGFEFVQKFNDESIADELMSVYKEVFN